MSIIISQNGKNAVKVERSDFDKENYLQEYIYQNPESIPLYDIKEDIKLLILAREFPTNSGPIDAIGIDKYGELYIVETKLFRNSDKRTVIAQALDYGAALWKHARDFNQFIAILDQSCQKTFNTTSLEKIKQFFGVTDEEAGYIVDKMRSNLNDGVFHFVILMDKLDDRLKDLVLYVNQNSQFDVYAVELEYYKLDTQEIIIPRIFGAEVKKDIGVSSNRSDRKEWNEQGLMIDAREKFTSEQFTAFEKLYNFTKEKADETRLGTGRNSSFSFIKNSISSKSIFTVTTDGRMSVNFNWILSDNEKFTEDLKNGLETVGIKFPENYKDLRPSVFIEEWGQKVDQIIEVISNLIK